MTQQPSAQQLLAQVNQLAAKKQISQALALVQAIHKNHSEFPEAWFAGAFLYFQTNQIDQARMAIKKARELAPDNQLYAFQEVMMLDAINRPAEALLAAKKLAINPLPNNDMNVQLAQLLEVNGAFKEAKTLFKHLSQAQPQNTSWLVKLAMIEQNYGHIEAAAELAQQALTINPRDTDALIFNSHLKKQSPDSNHIKQLESLKDGRWPAINDRAKIYFALAKELEDCGRYTDSFAARQQGADLYRRTFQYDVATDVAFLAQIQHDFDAQFLAHCDHDPSHEQPIFIVGLPRSGTTLLDRIISHHSDVTAAGELKHFNRSMLYALQQQNQGQQLSRTEMVTASKDLDFRQLGETYLANAKTSRGNTPRFTDKLPLNSHYVGHILKALPGAKIIIMQRHPIAVCYAVYKQLFYGQAYPYSYQLEELADYYIQHNKLLKHWQSVAEERVKTIYYEDLVNQLEDQTQSVLSFLDLPWQEQCLEFHTNQQVAATASASQVRQKIYTDSVAIWQNYEAQLAPLINKLTAAGCLDTP